MPPSPDVPDFAQLEADRLVIEYAPFAIAECVATAVSLLATRAREKKIALRSEVDSSVPAVVAGDATRVRQILVNLLSNAVTFTDHGEIVLRVTGQPLPDGGTELTFSVRDTGIGVPPGRLDGLFRPLSQVDDPTTRRLGGSGLGLVISRRLAELHGGRMGMESTPGVGSNFHFTIRTRPAVARPAPALPAVSEFDPAFASRHPARILVAEDNPVNQKVLVRLLQKLGYEPAVAGDGNAAIAALRKSDYDVVLMDVEMPGLDGPATTRALRAELPGTHQPVVVAVTAHALAGDREEFLAAGMDAYLAKPIRLEELTRLLGQLPGLRRP